MPISLARADQHIEEHTTRLRRFRRTRFWPRYLFHTAQANVVAAILRSGELAPRQAQGNLVHDVALPGAIAVNEDAIEYARLYFRPLTPFHLRTEGIKARNDDYRLDKHMSLPTTLVFDAKSVLVLENAGYNRRSLAHVHEQPDFTEAYFNNIRFDYVYHDQPTPADIGSEIRSCRMAEVVIDGSLNLRDHLKYIVCRTKFDSISLKNMIGNLDENTSERIKIEKIHRSIFFHKGIYIKNISFIENHLQFSLFIHSGIPKNYGIKVKIDQCINGSIVRTAEFTDQSGGKITKVGEFVPDENTVWKIDVEDVIAFQGKLPHEKSEVFG